MTEQRGTFRERNTSPEEESCEGKDLDQESFREMAGEYLTRIELPKEKGKYHYILCAVGLVGSGKTTVMKPLAERLNLARVSGDDVRKLLKDRGYNWQRTTDITLFAIKHLLGRGYSVAVDSDCAGKPVEEFARSLGAIQPPEVLYIHINPPEEFIINKLKKFQHSWLFNDADDALKSYYRRKPLHESLKEKFVFAVDTARQDVHEQIEGAVTAIKDRLEKK